MTTTDLLAISSPFLPFVIFALLVIVAVGAWYAFSPLTAGPFIAARVDYFCRLWRFVGPRMTDRNFVQAMLMNSGVITMFSLAPQTMNVITLGLVVMANLFNPTWDNHPAGEKLAPPNSQLTLDEQSALKAMLAEYKMHLDSH